MSFRDYSQKMYDWLSGNLRPKVVLVDAGGNERFTPANPGVVSLLGTAAVLLKGTATGGTETTIVDNTKDFDVTAFVNKIAKITIGGVEYYREVSAATGDTLTITTIKDDVGAIATVGTGKDAEGQAKIAVAEGTGANYSVKFTNGTGVGASAQAEYNTATGLLTIVSPTNAQSEPTGIMPNGLQAIIDANQDANGIFTVTAVVDVLLPTETAVLTFTNDEVLVGTGLPKEGQATVVCKGEIIGEPGNDYSIGIVQGVALTNDNIATLDAQTKLLTVTVNLDGGGNPRTITATELKTLLEGTAGISDKFGVTVVANDVLVIGGAAVDFAGGENGIPVTAGTPYEVLMG